MKQAMFWKKLKKNIVKCELCPNFCVIKENCIGVCRTRKNVKGKLYSLSYGYPVSMNVDPIEKKPIHGWMAGTNTFSIGTAGCNLKCDFCQNWEISQANPEEFRRNYVEPVEVVDEAIKNKCPSISYTYTEPVAFYEYALDIARIAKVKGLKNILVTNGYINQIPLAELLEFVDAANVDLKGFDEGFYKKFCGGNLKVVLESLMLMKKKGIYIEVTNLLIDGLNDDEENIRKMCKWIKKNLDCAVHFSRYFPMYKLHRRETKMETLLKAKKIAESEGLDKVYLGNV